MKDFSVCKIESMPELLFEATEQIKIDLCANYYSPIRKLNSNRKLIKKAFN